MTRTAKRVLASVVIAGVVTGLTYFIKSTYNCPGHVMCTDELWVNRGFPANYFSGSGGRAYDYVQVLTDLIFWFILAYICISFAQWLIKRPKS